MTDARTSNKAKKGIYLFPTSPSQQIKVIQLLPVPHDIPLDLAAVHPGDIILHIARHQERRVRDDLAADPHMALLDKRDRLHSSAPPPLT